MFTERQVSIANKIYENRRFMKQIHGDGYAEFIQPYKEIIQAAMKKHSLTSEMEAILQLSTVSGGFTAMDTAAFTAAACELIEPEQPK